MATRPVVDAHSHFTPHAIIDRLQASPGAFPSIELRDQGQGRFSFAFPGLPPNEGAAWSRLINEETLRELDGAERFLPLATVPIQSGRHAVKELEAAHGMGFRGLTIGTFAPGTGVELDHPDLDGLWETAARLEMPVVLHPLYLAGDPRLGKYD